MRVVVSERAIRELVREALEGEIPVNVSDVVDPSASLTDPGNEDYKPNNRVELQVAVKALSDDLPDEKVPDVYEKLVGALKVSDDEDGDEMKKDTKIEALVRAEVRRHLQSEAFPKKPKVFGPVVGPLPPVTKVPAGVHGAEYMRGFEKGKKDLKAILKKDQLDDFGGAVEDTDAETPEKRKFSTMTDVQGASFQDIAQQLGFSVAGAKQAVDKALQKAQWVGEMQTENPDDLEIIVLSSMNDYIKHLSKSGELSAADVQLMKDHPEIVRELDGFREFLDKAIRKARKGTELEDPLGESANTRTFKKNGVKIVLEKKAAQSPKAEALNEAAGSLQCTIELDCQPGASRPSELISVVIEGTGLPLRDPIKSLMGESTWDYSDMPDAFADAQSTLKQRIVDLYDRGMIRYGSW